MKATEFVEKALGRVAEALDGDESTLAGDLDALTAEFIEKQKDAKGHGSDAHGGGALEAASKDAHTKSLAAADTREFSAHAAAHTAHEHAFTLSQKLAQNRAAPAALRARANALNIHHSTRIAQHESVMRDHFNLDSRMRSALKSPPPVQKSADAPTVTVLKLDTDQHMAWGWALVSVDKGEQVHDLQGDLVDTDELQHAVHGSFMQGGRVGKAMHSGGPIGEVVDSIVFTKELQDALGIDLGREGWFVGMKITDPGVWKRVKAGELPAFSIGGEGERHPMVAKHDGPPAMFRDVLEKARKILGTAKDAPLMFEDVVAKQKDAKGHGSNAHGLTSGERGYNAEGRPVNRQGHPSVGLHLPTSHASPNKFLRGQSAKADAGSKIAREAGIMSVHAKLANKFREGGFTAKANHHDRMSSYHEKQVLAAKA